MPYYDAIIIGAGPAGLFAALASSGARVAVLESNARAGRKLLLSGTGQCNFTHTGEAEEFLSHYGRNGRFLRFAYAAFNNTNFTDFLRQQGLATITHPNGKLFPACGNAAVIRDMLVNSCLACGVEFHYRKTVKSILQSKPGFTLSGDGFSCETRCLVLATGGMSYSDTGSTGVGFVLAQALGHLIISPTPALAPFFIQDFAYGSCAGISFKARLISVWRGGRKIAFCQGDILLTHQGLSGPGVLDLARYAEAGDICKVEFISPETQAKLEQLIVDNRGRKSLKGLLTAHTDLAAGFLEIFLAECRQAGRLGERQTAANLTKAERKFLLGRLLAYPFIIAHKGDFNIAMATAGGVALEEVNPKTMESKLVPGLFFAGEVLDLDGDTGGYNIQAAASTGMAAGRGVQKQLQG